MGTDKAPLVLNGKSFTERIAETLATISTRVTLVGRVPDDVILQLPHAPDIHPGWGALGGIHGALSACQSKWALIIACDLPFVTTELLTHLAAARTGYQAVAPIQKDGRPQPLCALYEVSACLKQTEQLIQSGMHRPLSLLQCVRTCWVPFTQLLGLKDAEKFFLNINTPQDYALALELGPTSTLSETSHGA
jgi:molybdopterin-guanine dinucleotide biosynthesis protein A